MGVGVGDEIPLLHWEWEKSGGAEWPLSALALSSQSPSTRTPKKAPFGEGPLGESHGGGGGGEGPSDWW